MSRPLSQSPIAPTPTPVGPFVQPIWRAWALAGLGMTASLSLSGCGESQRSLMAAGKELALRQDHLGAIVKFKAALQKDGSLAEGRLLLGQSLLAVGDPDTAAVELGKAHQQQHAPDQVVPALARALVLTGESHKLVQQFGGLQLSDAGATASLQSSLATAWAALGERAKTEAAAAAALAAKPDYGPALVLQARLLAGRGEPEQAQQVLQQLLARQPQVHEAWHLGGEILLHHQNDERSAEAAFRKALAIEPTYLPAHLALVSLRLQERDFGGARTQAKQLRAALPRHPQVQLVDAQILFQAGDAAAAREAIQHLLKGVPNHLGILLLAGAIEAQAGSLVLAQTYLARAVQSDPESVLARRNLAHVYLRQGQATRALDSLGPLLMSKANVAEAHALAAEAHLQLGDTRSAEASLLRAAKLAPDNLRVRTALALSNLARGDEIAAFAELHALSGQDKYSFVDMALVNVHLKRRELDAALRVAKAMVLQHGGNSAAQLMLGRVQLARKDSAAARLAFEQALKLDPRQFVATASLAALDLGDHKPELAQRRFEAAIRSDPRNHLARVALADMLATVGAPPQQVNAVLLAAVKATPSEPAPRLRLINRALVANQAKEALQLAQDAHTAVPHDPDLLEALGRAQAEAGDKQQAIGTFKRLAAADTASGAPHLRIAEVYRGLGELALAEQYLKKALEIQPELALAQTALAQLLQAGQRSAEALALARKVQLRRPGHASGYVFEAALHLAAGHIDAALAAYRFGLDRAGESSELAVALHKALVGSARDAEADKLATRWSRTYPDDAAFLYQLALTDIRRQALPMAEERLKQVLALRPGHALALNNLAWLLVARGKPGAVELARQAVHILPARPALMDTLAQALLFEKQVTQALDLQKKAVELAPGDNALRLNLARIAHRAGEKALARKELLALQAADPAPHIRDEITKLLKVL